MMSFLDLPVSRQKLWGAIICVLSGVVLLAITSSFFNTREPHLYGALNDQIAYINVARNLAASGTVKSDTILPSTLWQRASRDVLYMPGHPATMALFYKLFGFGSFQTVLPSLLAYLIAMLAIYFIGVKIYEPLVGLLASLLFALFPPMLFFAFTAMSEITLVAAFTLGICVCLYLPPRLRPWLGPLCLAVPFLFRETASYAVIPMGLYFWFDKRDGRWRAIVFVILTTTLLAVLFKLDFSAGRPFLLKANLFGDSHAVYDDALAQQVASSATWRDWVSVIPSRTFHNVIALFLNTDFAPFASGANYLLMTAMALVAFVAFRQGDKLARAVTLLNTIAVLSLVVLFSVSGYRGTRYLLFIYPLDVVVIAGGLVKSWPGINLRAAASRVSSCVIAAAITFLGLSWARHFYLSLVRPAVMKPSLPHSPVNVFYLLVIAIGVIGVIVLRRRQLGTETVRGATNSKLPLAPAALIIIVAAAVTISYIPDYRAVCLAAILFSVSLASVTWLRSKLLDGSEGTLIYVTISVALLCALSLGAVRDMYTLLTAQDTIDREFAAALSKLDIDQHRVLVSPHEVSTRYRYDHFGLVWSFLPNNRPTLDLLASRFEIGTMIVPENHALTTDSAALASMGFARQQVFSVVNQNYVVYVRPLR